MIYFRNRFKHETPRRRDVWHALSAVLTLTAILTSVLVIVPAAPAVAAVAIVETQIASSADDVEERASGSMRLTSSDLEMVYDNGTQTIGLRFPSIAVPAGATITASWIQFTTDETNADPASLIVKGQAADSADAYAQASFNLTSRPVTTNSVAWSPAPWNTVGEASLAQRTPDLSAVVQEIVGRPGWSEGNTLAFSITGSGARVAESVNGKPSAAPLLHIEFDMAINAFPIVMISSPDAGSTFVEGSPVTLTGAATDVEDGDLSEAITWSSDVDGPLGTGATVVTSTLTAANHRITATVVDSALQSAFQSLNLDIEPPGGSFSFETRITTGTDDAEERANGDVRLASSDLEMTLDRGGDQTIGLRFASVTIPQGVMVADAWVQFQSDETDSGATSLTIRGEASDAPKSFSSATGNITSRPVTAASVAWAPEPWPVTGLAGDEQRTPDLTAIVQEIVDRGGWVAGSPLVLVIDGTGERVAESFEGDASAGALLHIEYDEPTNFTPTVSITAPGEGATFTEGDSIGLAGTATDPEDGDLSSQIEWTSSLDGPLGIGSALNVTLSQGAHQITATGTDSSLAEGSDGVAIVVDPLNPSMVLDLAVTTGSDDAEQRSSGRVLLASSDLELTFDAGGHQIVGVRFGNVAIPPDAVVTAASLQFTADETNTEPTSLTVRAQAADNPATFTSQSGGIGSAQPTTASTAWTPAPWNVVGQRGPDQRTPDLAALVQELVDRPAWTSGNAMVFLINGTGERVAESFNGNAGAAPSLHLEFVPSPNVSPTISIDAPLDGSAFFEGATVTLNGTALDQEDGNLAPVINWSSNRDGVLGAGNSVATANLSVGLHTIEAQVVDSGNAVSSALIRITIEANDPFLIGAGDIGECANDRDEAVGDLIAAFPNSTAYTLGDNAYPNGTALQFANCYDPSWGSFLARTKPSAGNHDYFTPGASGYFEYFGAAAGDPSEGWYSYDLGSWHIVVLNSNCGQVGGCGSASPQAAWLAADLAANPAECTLAYWHHPQFSSGLLSNGSYEVFWQILHDAGADVVLNAHSHHYERFAPQDPAGVLDPEHGIRQFVVGTGGDELEGTGAAQDNSEVTDFSTYGALGLTLRDGSYDWQFIPVEGQSFTDEGSSDCVDAGTAVDVRVESGADDAEERDDGRMLVGSSDLEMTFDAGGDQTLGLRFASVDLPAGATITNAWIQFEVDETNTSPTLLTVWGEAVDSAVPYSSAVGNITSRARTIASVAWAPPAWNVRGAAGADQRTPDLKPVIQAIVDRPGWTTGSPIAVIIDGSGERVAESFDGESTAAPLLHIEYSLA